MDWIPKSRGWSIKYLRRCNGIRQKDWGIGYGRQPALGHRQRQRRLHGRGKVGRADIISEPQPVGLGHGPGHVTGGAELGPQRGTVEVADLVGRNGGERERGPGARAGSGELAGRGGRRGAVIAAHQHGRSGDARARERSDREDRAQHARPPGNNDGIPHRIAAAGRGRGSRTDREGIAVDQHAEACSDDAELTHGGRIQARGRIGMESPAWRGRATSYALERAGDGCLAVRGHGISHGRGNVGEVRVYRGRTDRGLGDEWRLRKGICPRAIARNSCVLLNGSTFSGKSGAHRRWP